MSESSGPDLFSNLQLQQINNEQPASASYAMRPALSRGRMHQDHDTQYRGLFQRDRDRIVHSSAFRRLQYKTQVFVSVMEGDYYRNRLTHTLEVTQIARTIARALSLNEDLTEALALAHDLGHGPFGHSGEHVLEEVMRGKGGFEHNAQGLRIVDVLEHRYPRFPGLNLTYETREGYGKNYLAMPAIPASSGSAVSPVPGNVRFRQSLGFEADERPTLEVQLVGHADEIAYDTHDLDDGLVSGALDANKVRSVALWHDTEAQVRSEDATFNTDQRLCWLAVVRRLIATLVSDLLNETRRRLAANKITSVDDVRHCGIELVGFSDPMAARKQELETFLMANFYNSPQVRERTEFWQERLRQLFAVYQANPGHLPEDNRKRAAKEGHSIDRVICDYVAGMTDRFAKKQWEMLVGK